MAHDCPECGSVCYCGGDIDDILFEDSDEQFDCTHYLRAGCDAYERDDDCMDCGMCDSCIERTKAHFEEMERAAGKTPEGRT